MNLRAVWRALVLAWACASGAPGTAHVGTVAVTDDSGHRVELSAPAGRIVALAPHLTELVFAAGAGERLVAVSRYSDHPPQAASLPVVGDAMAIDFERVVQLAPDLVLVWRSGLNPRHRERLRSLGLTVFESEIATVEQIADTLHRLGLLAGTPQEADAAAGTMLTRWRTLARAHVGQRPVRVFYQLWDEPLMTVNRQHLISQAIEACGGVNVFANLPTLTASVGWESALQADPQLVVTGRSRDEPARLDAWRRHPGVSAVLHGQLKVLDGPALARMSPRFVDAAQGLCRLIEAARR